MNGNSPDHLACTTASPCIDTARNSSHVCGCIHTYIHTYCRRWTKTGMESSAGMQGATTMQFVPVSRVCSGRRVGRQASGITKGGWSCWTNLWMWFLRWIDREVEIEGGEGAWRRKEGMKGGKKEQIGWVILDGLYSWERYVLTESQSPPCRETTGTPDRVIFSAEL